MDEPSSRDTIANYLSKNSNVPLTRDELIDHVVLNTLKYVDMSKYFKVKRVGIDRDPIFWTWGKIHGLENIAFADP